MTPVGRVSPRTCQTTMVGVFNADICSPVRHSKEPYNTAVSRNEQTGPSTDDGVVVAMGGETCDVDGVARLTVITAVGRRRPDEVGVQATGKWYHHQFQWGVLAEGRSRRKRYRRRRLRNWVGSYNNAVPWERGEEVSGRCRFQATALKHLVPRVTRRWRGR